MIGKVTLSAIAALGLAAPAIAAGGAGHVEDFEFSFEGRLAPMTRCSFSEG